MNKTFLLSIIFVILICIPVILPYFHSGYFPTHDGEWAVVRLADMYREVKDLQIPPRFSTNLNFGYGYPLFNFAYPFPYYLGLIGIILKLGLVGSIKVLFAGSVIFSVVAMYFASKELWGSKLAGVISAVLYAYFPYRMVDLFVRGSIGETISMFFFPWILLCLLKIQSKKPLFFSILAGISFAMLIMTHNIMGVFFSLLIVPFAIFLSCKNRKTIPYYLLTLLLGLGLSAYFWLPALLEKKYIVLSVIPIANRNLYFVSFQKLLFSQWGYGVPTDPQSFTYQLGWPFVILLLSVAYVFIIHWKRQHETVTLFHKQAALVLFTIATVMMFMLFSVSSPLWHLPILAEINYPWTLLLPLGFIFSLLGGFLTRFPYSFKIIAIFTSCLAVILYIPFAHPEKFVDRSDSYYLTNDATTTSSDELMPLWVKQKPLSRPENAVEVLNNKGDVTLLGKSSKQIVFSVNLLENATVQINTIYYPGWKVTSNDVETNMSYKNLGGLMQINLPQGTHTLTATFSETAPRKVSDVISLLTILSIPFLFLLTRKFVK